MEASPGRPGFPGTKPDLHRGGTLIVNRKQKMARRERVSRIGERSCTRERGMRAVKFLIVRSNATECAPHGFSRRLLSASTRTVRRRKRYKESASFLAERAIASGSCAAFVTLLQQLLRIEYEYFGNRLRVSRIYTAFTLMSLG